jgi:hypothetical protein
MYTNAQTRLVYRSFLDYCDESTLDEPWNRFKNRRSVFQFPKDPFGALNGLLAEFPPQALEESGIVTTENGKPNIHPSMCTPETRIVPLFEEKEDSPIDLLTETGCLSGRKIPSCATLHDSRMRDLIGGSGNVVLVAFSVRDLAVLDAAGLATTLAVGLEELGQESLKEFCCC